MEINNQYGSDDSEKMQSGIFYQYKELRGDIMSEEKGLLKGIPFYIAKDVFLWLLEKYNERENAEFFFGKGDDFSIDIIEIPVHFEIKTEKKEESISFLIYARSELGVYTEDFMMLSFKIYNNSDEPKVFHRNDDSDFADLCMNYLKSAVQLRKHIMDNNLMDQFANLDMNTEGVLVTFQNDNLIFERVSGRKRPSMLFTSLFGSSKMMRLYPDEIVNSQMDKKSFEEKLEAAEDGDKDAMEQVAIAYLNGDENDGIESDPGKAAYWYWRRAELAAEDGDEDAMEQVAITYLNGDENKVIESNPEKAAYWLFKLAELDNPMGCFNLAILFIKGQGVEQNFEQALHWMGKALLNGNEEAVLYASKLREIIDLKEKILTGDLSAKVDLARAYLWLGIVLGDDFNDIFAQKSVALAEEAEAAGIADAEWILGQAYEKGQGVASDMGKAIEHYRRGAELGNVICQFMLGAIYLVGNGVPTNPEKGFELIMKAAEQGNGHAMKVLGSCYQEGHGVDKSMKKAIYWYEKALEVIDDPELAQEVMDYKSFSDIDDDGEESG